MEKYLVNPEYLADRKADYKAGEYLNKVFKPLTAEDAYKIDKGELCGNVHNDLLVNAKTRKIRLKTKEERFEFNIKGTVRLYEAISSALALYRTICLISKPIISAEGADGYKVPYAIYLKHEPTGKVLSISEWKGAFGVWTPFLSADRMPDKYKKDMFKLVNLILSNKSPHPYDDVTAGSVA